MAHETAILGRPAWLDDWTASGATITLESPRGPAAATRTLELYERLFEPGIVSLGGNRPHGTAYPKDAVMYAVFVRL